MRLIGATPLPHSCRILMYSHDTFGLGHLRRSVRLAEAVSGDVAQPTILIATGSPLPEGFDLPPGCDVVKLPCVGKLGDAHYESTRLRCDSDQVRALRTGILQSLIETFTPDLLWVDHAPVGVNGELAPLLDRCRTNSAGPATILGLRDVIDSPERVRAEWDRLKVWPHLMRTYDRVLVYGDPSITTTATELDLPHRLGGRLTFTGYLVPDLPSEATEPGRRVVATVGGGADGRTLADGFLAAMAQLTPEEDLRGLLVTGPFCPESAIRSFRERVARNALPVDIVPFQRDLLETIRTARCVVSMAGYNTAMEVIAAGRPTCLVPRAYPRHEQSIRAARLAERIPWVELENLDDPDLAHRLAAFIRAPHSELLRPAALMRNGLRTAAAAAMELLASRQSEAPRVRHAL